MENKLEFWNKLECPDISFHLEVGLEECLRSSFWTWLSEGRSAGTSGDRGPGEEVKRVEEERTGLRSLWVGRSEPSGRLWPWGCGRISSEDLCDHQGAGPGPERSVPRACGEWWLLVALQTAP